MEIVLHYWPILVFVPALLVLIAALALITRLVDRD